MKPMVVGSMTGILIAAASLTASANVAPSVRAAKPCAATGTIVRANGKPAKNSGNENSGKLFKDRKDKRDEDQERAIGRTANLGGYTTTVVGGGFAEALSDFETNGYLRVSVKLCSRDDGTQGYTPFDWSVQTPAGQVIQPTFSLSPTLDTGDLIKGGEIAGDVIFEVGPQRGDFYVIYTPSSELFEDSRGIWKLTI
ncbi:MAG: hypothetical protein WEC34_00220 [Acidimicrobiia bacterium]